MSRLLRPLFLSFALLGASLSGVSAETLRVALDPGHGGSDPGADAAGLTEADLVLDFARRLAVVIEKDPRFDVVLTRETDRRVALESRLTRARQAGADIFISLHADALEEGDGVASGVTVYTLADGHAADADLRQTERHARNDLLTGLDLSETGDDVALVLMEMARRETLPRSKALAAALVGTFSAGDLAVNRRPHRHGGYAVLKAADIPSVLIELGFLSSRRDRERLTSDTWLDGAARAIRDGIVLWADEDRLMTDAFRN